MSCFLTHLGHSLHTTPYCVKKIFFQNRRNHVFAPKCSTAEVKYDLETPVLWLFDIFYFFSHYYKDFQAKLQCESCVSFFQNQLGHIYATKCLTAVINYDLESPVLSLFDIFYYISHLN